MLLEFMFTLLTLKYNTEMAGMFGCPDKINGPKISTKIFLYFLLLYGLVQDSFEVDWPVSILRVNILVTSLEIERHFYAPLRNLHILLSIPCFYTT